MYFPIFRLKPQSPYECVGSPQLTSKTYIQGILYLYKPIGLCGKKARELISL